MTYKAFHGLSPPNLIVSSSAILSQHMHTQTHTHTQIIHARKLSISQTHYSHVPFNQKRFSSLYPPRKCLLILHDVFQMPCPMTSLRVPFLNHLPCSLRISHYFLCVPTTLTHIITLIAKWQPHPHPHSKHHLLGT